MSGGPRSSPKRGTQFNTGRKNDSVPESIKQLNATIMRLSESIKHLKDVNEDLRRRYDNQKKFISIAAHELRSPITPILATLEFIEYEFEEGKKTDIMLNKEFFDTLVRNTNRLEKEPLIL